MQYEIFYLISGSKEAEVLKIKEEVREIITKSEGEFLEKETLEKRKLAYKIKHETQGIYIAQRFNLENIDNLKDINRKMNLNGNILRFILSRADELPELKSKEERIAEATEKEETQKLRERKPEKKEEARKKPEEAGEEKSEESVMGDDIDKKLEEILNT